MRILSIILAFLAVSVTLGTTTLAEKPRKAKELRITKVKPRGGASFVRTNKQIKIKFNQRINKESITPQNISIRPFGGKELTWGYSLSKNGRIIILNKTPLLKGTNYEIRIKDIVSVKGAKLDYEHVSVFYTIPDSSSYPYPDIGRFITYRNMLSVGRAHHNATIMPDGSVLLSGGLNGIGVNDTADIIEVTPYHMGAVDRDLRMFGPRAFHFGARIEKGALLMGGWNGDTFNNPALKSTEIYDFWAKQFIPGPSMVEARDFIAGVKLKDGRILIVGGLTYLANKSAWYSSTAEIYDPATGEFRLTLNNPNIRRAGHVVTLLDDGRVLITGGSSWTSSAEIFDPETETFRFTDSDGLYIRQSHGAALMPDGKVFIAGGDVSDAEIFDPISEKFQRISGGKVRFYGTVVYYKHPVIIGGFDNTFTFIYGTWDVFDEFANLMRESKQFTRNLAGHSATMVENGVLLAGGFENYLASDSITILR